MLAKIDLRWMFGIGDGRMKQWRLAKIDGASVRMENKLSVR